MRIKWKFMEEREETGEHGNLKNYYKDSEPWKKPRPKPNLFLQILKVILVIAVFLVIIIAALSIKVGYDWNEAGIIRIMRNIIIQRGWI
jgi:type IV secretory pathway component VirB8